MKGPIINEKQLAFSENNGPMSHNQSPNESLKRFLLNCDVCDTEPGLPNVGSQMCIRDLEC